MPQPGDDAETDFGPPGLIPGAARPPASPAATQPLPRWSSQPPVKASRSLTDRLSDALDHLTLGVVMLPMLPWVVMERRRRRIERRSPRGAETDRAIELATQRLKALLQPPSLQTRPAVPRRASNPQASDES